MTFYTLLSFTCFLFFAPSGALTLICQSWWKSADCTTEDNIGLQCYPEDFCFKRVILVPLSEKWSLSPNKSTVSILRSCDTATPYVFESFPVGCANSQTSSTHPYSLFQILSVDESDLITTEICDTGSVLDGSVDYWPSGICLGTVRKTCNPNSTTIIDEEWNSNSNCTTTPKASAVIPATGECIHTVCPNCVGGNRYRCGPGSRLWIVGLIFGVIFIIALIVLIGLFRHKWLPLLQGENGHSRNEEYEPVRNVN